MVLINYLLFSNVMLGFCVCFSVMFGFCEVVCSILSSLAIFSLRELVALR